MADTKITALTAITTVDPANDVLPIVDVSDTSMAASGTTKKITTNQILGASGTATLASATITGALTVSGAANLNGAVNLNIAGASTVTLGASSSYGLLTGSGANAASIYISGATRSGFESKLNCGAAEYNWYNSSYSSLIATLNSTGLGVGVSPQTGYKITSNGNIAFWNSSRADFQNSDNTAAFGIQCSGSSSTASWNLVQLGVTNRMTFDWSGNMILILSNTPPTLGTDGQLTVNATSNTNLRFSYRGSDGVTRVANITLA